MPDMLRQQFTHPESNDPPPAGSAPFIIRSVELEACICQDNPMHNDRCSYHRVLTLQPDKRTKAMKAAIQSQDLVFEAGKLLLSTRAYTQELDEERLSNLKGKFETSEEAAVMEKSIVKLIKAALMHHGTCTGNYIPCILELNLRLGFLGVSNAAGFCPMERDESSWDRAKSLSWLHLLAAVPILMAHVATMHPRRLLAATQTATIALALMELNKRRWEPLLESHGLSLWEYEVVVRIHLSNAIFQMISVMPEAAVANYSPVFAANAEFIYRVQPTNNWNLVFCALLEKDIGKRCQLLREAVRVADDDGDDSSSISLRWILCHAILLGGEGPSLTVAEILSFIKKARAAMDEAERWTNPKEMLLPDKYWPCLGVAARYRAAIKEDSSFARSRMPAYASSADLECEKRHVMCEFCDEMCSPLKRCSGCESVGYCSKKCQIMDWKAGHKHACKQHSKPDSQDCA